MFVAQNVTFLKKQFLMDHGDYRKIELDELNQDVNEPMMKSRAQSSRIPLTHPPHR